MRVICVDDERLIMEDMVALCREMPGISEVKGFVSASDALAWLRSSGADIALLDIDMPEINGLEFASMIKTVSPDTFVLFVTGYSQYAVDAFKVRAAGYLLKPVSKEALKREIDYILSLKQPEKNDSVMIKTFGDFDVFKGGEAVRFKIAKCKELLAYLVDRQGSGVTRAQLSSVLWEDRLYDRKQQKQLDVYIRALKETLSEYGISEIIETQRGTLRVVPGKFTCDAYLFFAGDAAAVNAYRGEYMNQYSWAVMTEAAIFRKFEREIK